MEDEYQVLPGSRRYHQGRAAYFRELASTVTTGSVKAHLLREAEQHEQLARSRPALIVKDAGRPMHLSRNRADGCV